MADDPHDPRPLNPADAPPPADAPAPASPDLRPGDAPSPPPAGGDEAPFDDEGAPPDAPPARTPFLGEIVQRRSWPLIAVVFVFAVFLAVVPFLFQVEPSPFRDALALYDRICTSRGRPTPADLTAATRALPPDGLATALAGLPCVTRTDYRPRMDPVEGRQYGTARAFVVTLEHLPSASPASGPAQVRFLVEEEDGAIRWAPWPATAPQP